MENGDHFVAGRHVKDAGEGYFQSLRDVLAAGEEVAPGLSHSVGKGRKSKEILNYSLVIANPTERLPYTTQFFLPGAIARFVWMMAANNRLKDIEFYWGSKVSRFSDDGILVPGSSYGERMLHARPGVNQVQGIVERLKTDPSTRRAAVAIYQAEDAIRESGDIPCAFGLFYHVREGKLHGTVMMRSNNALRLLPYNLFEFSWLAEAIAAEIRIPLGTLTYHAVSMHVYEDDYQAAESLVGSDIGAAFPAVPKIPSEPSPIEQIRELVRLESDARHAAAGFSGDNFEEWLDRGMRVLNPYWQQPYFLLLLHMASVRKVQPALGRLSEMIATPWKARLSASAFSAGVSTSSNVDLFGQRTGAVAVTNGTELYRTRLTSLEELCFVASKRYTERGRPLISLEEYKLLRDRFVGSPSEPFAVAARMVSAKISSEEFEQALLEIRK
jgi:thymidylate synthase